MVEWESPQIENDRNLTRICASKSRLRRYPNISIQPFWAHIVIPQFGIYIFMG